jgi:hypothetical protein
MIDDNLIKNSVDHARCSIAEQKFLIPGILGAVQNMLHPDLRAKLNHFLKFSDCEWVPELKQEDLPRKKINWEPESVIEELHEIMTSLTPTVNALFPSESPLHFWGISLWKDTEGYYIHEHKDNTDLHSVIHVYLDSEGPCPGTVFQHAGSSIDINHVANTGYIYCNGRERLTHNISYTVPRGTVRYSLYAQWSLLPKYFPNTPQ